MALTPEQNDAWRSLVLLTHVLDAALDRQAQRDGGLPHAYYKVLVFLYEAPDRRMSMTALAEAQRYSGSRMTHAVSSMERSGWVQRTTSPADGRVRVVEITAAGIQLLRTVSPGQIAEVRQKVFANLSDAQVQQLTLIGQSVIAGLDALDA